MSRRDLSNQDVSSYASSELDVVLRRQIRQASGPAIPTVTAEEAMAHERLVQVQSDRSFTRVLFISQNTELLNPTQQSLDGYLNISEVFDEVHILILRRGITPRQPVIRPEKNVFMYTVARKYWWQLPKAGLDMIESQVVFADGLRADLVVALDPFESAVTALWATKKYPRPTQLHVLKNVFTSSSHERADVLHRLLAKFTIPRFLSVRVATQKLQTIVRGYTEQSDVNQLPRLNPYDMVSHQTVTTDIQQTYPQYVFRMLFVGSLETADAALAAVDAARYMLKNPQVCLMIVGDGAGVSECKRYVKTLGIEKQVIFIDQIQQQVQYLKQCDLLIATNTNPASEELVLQGAAAHIPMVMTRTERRDDTFTHLESAYMCEPGDVQAYSDGVHELITNQVLLQQLTERAYADIKDRFHDDYDVYRQGYQASVEAALFAGEDKATVSGQSAAI